MRKNSYDKGEKMYEQSSQSQEYDALKENPFEQGIMGGDDCYSEKGKDPDFELSL